MPDYSNLTVMAELHTTPKLDFMKLRSTSLSLIILSRDTDHGQPFCIPVAIYRRGNIGHVSHGQMFAARVDCFMGMNPTRSITTVPRRQYDITFRRCGTGRGRTSPSQKEAAMAPSAEPKPPLSKPPVSQTPASLPAGGEVASGWSDGFLPQSHTFWIISSILGFKLPLSMDFLI